MKKHISNIVLVVILLAGLSLLVYPSFADWWNTRNAASAVAKYNEYIEEKDTTELDALWKQAERYNRSMNNKNVGVNLSPEQKEVYNNTLNIGGNGVIGYIDIPMQNITLPIYHGTDEAVLMVGVGHLEWSQLPTGGKGNHVVLSGHRGLPSARLFTDIDKMVVGDIFYLDILNKTLTYEVDEITIVLPQELSSLRPVRGEDLCTLVTCTPYGVNSHRLLVRGHRIENLAATVRVTADAQQITTVYVAGVLAVPMLLVLFVILMVDTGRHKEEEFDL